MSDLCVVAKNRFQQKKHLQCDSFRALGDWKQRTENGRQ